MLPNLRKTIAATGLLAVLTMIAGTSRVYAQGYVYSPGGGYYYAGAANSGYTYPSYSYSYWSQGRSTVPSGYYTAPSGGGYYYQPFAPAVGSPTPAPAPRGPAPVASAPAPAPYTTAREAALEARVRRLESAIDNLNRGAVRTTVPSGNNSYFPEGNTRIERDSRYPNWSFDHSQWLAHNL